MIYTVTFNPSLDYIVTVDEFRLGMTNRTSSEMMLPGGKGINVSIILHNLEMENTALGFLAGFTGEKMEQMLQEMGISERFLKLENGNTRINLKLKNIDGTEINGEGPQIPPEALETLMKQLDELKKGDVLVLAGSIPACISDDIYQKILKRLEAKELLFIVDAASSLLMKVLPYRPFLVKPNQHELGEIFGVVLTEKEEVIPYAKELQKAGAQNVLVSMGGQGAVLAAADGRIYEAEAPKGELKNSVGAGDSMVAGFLTGWLKTQSYEEAFRYGVGAGSASAFSDHLASKAEIQKIAGNVVIHQIKG